MIYKKIILEGNQKVFFTSDLHFSHKNICKGTTEWDLDDHGGHLSVRDFETPEQMNETIIANINKMVGEDDYLVSLGDWSFKSVDEIYGNRKKINCKNIIHILGNHCEKIAANRELPNWTAESDRKQYAQQCFKSVHEYLELTVSGSHNGKQTYNLFHFPMVVWNKGHHDRVHLFGHVHGSYEGEGRSLDVGIDNAFKLYGEYRPFSQEDISKYMEDKEFKKLSHHNPKTN